MTTEPREPRVRRTEVPSPADPPSDAPRIQTGNSRLRDSIPNWVSALAGVISVILVVVGYNAVSNRDEPRDRTVRVVSFVCCKEGLSAVGEYAALRSGREEVVLLAKPSDDTPGRWLHVAAELSPERRDEQAGTEDGRWDVLMPIEASSASWEMQPVIIPAGLSGLEPGALEELTRLGPEASTVSVRGDPVRVEPAP